MKILLFDNYDSFTYNLVHILKELHADVEVHRNDKITEEEAARFDKILLSPGPGIPEKAGILLPLVQRYAPSKSLLGVCLGEQAIGQVFGAKLTNPEKVYHGISSDIHVVTDDPLFEGLTPKFRAGRYHSWMVSREGFPDCLEITATDSIGEIMAIRHKEYNVRGVQFHPESILTPKGKTIIQNWLKI